MANVVTVAIECVEDSARPTSLVDVLLEKGLDNRFNDHHVKRRYQTED